MAFRVADKAFLEAVQTGREHLAGQIEDYPEGIVLPLDKPLRWTSADVVRKLKFAAARHFGRRNLKVGHAGTLDPLATGLLLVCIGKATRQAEILQKSDKEYLARITFGATTPSYDREKEIDRFYPLDGVNLPALQQALGTFLGEQEQIAPLFSAKSVDGIRAYELARKALRSGADPAGFDHSQTERLSRQVIRIHTLECLHWWPEGASRPLTGSDEPARSPSPPDETVPNGRDARIHLSDNSGLRLPQADIRMVCSKGTYVRAFARDLGEALGSGAFLDALRRTRCGGFDADQALSPEQAVALFSTRENP